MIASLQISCLVAAFVAAHSLAAPQVTSLTNPDVKYKVAAKHYVVLKQGDVTAVIVDNAAVNDDVLPKHRAGYNGVASLTHRQRKQNLFVPGIAGLNYEHIHDGTLAVSQEKFEPRKNDMQLRVIDEQTVELYQPPTKYWQLESCGRYQLLKDGTIEYTFECIPRKKTFQQNYIGLFWASYIHAPEDKSIWFQGRAVKHDSKPRWINGITPKHGVDSTHPPAGYTEKIKVDPEFPLTLVNHPSKYAHTGNWYYGVSHDIAFVQMFRPQDTIWLAQSPSGGGSGNPAWDFQWFIPNYKVGEAYGFVMRASYLPFKNRQQLIDATRSHRKALGIK